MKVGCVAILLSVAVLIGAFGLIVILRSGPPQEIPAPSPTPLPESYLRSVGSLNRFRRAETDGRYYLTYGFIDHHGRRHELTCAIDERAHREAAAAFGYRKAALGVAAQRKLQPWVERQIRERGLAGVLRFVVAPDGGYEWSWQLPGDLPVPESRKREAEVGSFLKQLSAAYERESQAYWSAAYREHGFKLQNHVVEIDYAGVVERSASSLDDCFRSLENSGKGYTRRQELGLFLAFLQEIRYELPPDEIEGRQVLGFWVPTEVLVGDHGDCDSKSATFAALWRHLDTPLILISVPRHMLVGVEVRPGPGEAFVRIGNRYFVLCEPAGPAKIHPGATGLSGSFEYVLLEPGRPGAVEGAAAAD